MRRSLRDWKFWVLTVTAVGLLAMSIVNASMRSDVRARQMEIAERQQFLIDSAAWTRLNTQIIQALAQLAAQGNDADIRDMLAKHGVTYSLDSSAAPVESAKRAAKP